MTVPYLTTPAVKAFSKTLRARLSSGRNLEQLPGDLVDQLAHQSRIGFPTRTTFIENSASVTCIAGHPGTGKTTMSVFAASIGSSIQNHRVLFLTSLNKWASAQPPLDALSALGFKGVQSSDLDEALVADRANLIVYECSSLDLEAILASELSNTLIVTDELFRADQDQLRKYLDLLPRILRKKPGVQAIIGEQINCYLQLAEDYHGSNFAPPPDHLQNAVTAWLLLGIESQESVSYLHGDTVLKLKFPRVPHDKPFPDTVRAMVKKRSFDADKIRERICKFIQSGSTINTHTEALETTSKLLGYSSWHALQGYLTKAEKQVSAKPKPLSFKQVTEAIRKHTGDADDMWLGRTLKTVEVLCSAQIDVREPDLLDRMIQKKDRPEIETYLASLPGYPNNTSRANEMLGYATMMAIRAVEREFGKLAV